MKTALLLTGNPRFSIDFDSQLENLKYSDIDVFAFFWKRKRGEDPKISDNWHVETPEQVREKLEPYLPKNYTIKHIELIDPQLVSILPRNYESFYSTPINVWQQYNILKYCDNCREQYGHYELVIRSRTDIGLSEMIDLPLAFDTLLKNPRWIFIPNNQRYGYRIDIGGYMSGFNDQFAIGLPDTMKIYTNAVDNFDYLYEKGIKYNPEYLLQTHLYINNIIWTPTSFEILRDPAHWVPIEHGKWEKI